MIKEGNDPERICKFLGKCATMNPKQPEITECEVCTAVVDLIKIEIEFSNGTIEVIIKAVEALCAILGDVPVYEEVSVLNTIFYSIFGYFIPLVEDSLHSLFALLNVRTWNLSPFFSSHFPNILISVILSFI